MDAEQIGREMSATRTSIDRKLDALAMKAEAAKEETVRQALAVGSIVLAGWFAIR
jgi:hypothetical protein